MDPNVDRENLLDDVCFLIYDLAELYDELAEDMIVDFGSAPSVRISEDPDELGYKLIIGRAKPSLVSMAARFLEEASVATQYISELLDDLSKEITEQ